MSYNKNSNNKSNSKQNNDLNTDDDNHDYDKEIMDMIEEESYRLEKDQYRKKKDFRKKIKRKSEDASTIEGVIDLPTAKIISKFINQGYTQGLEGVISTGKEANVYHAYASNEEMTPSLSELAIKIYRTRTLDFRKIKNYIAGDIRFQKFGHKNHQIIEIWALKEFKNLKRAFENNIRVPQPVVVRRNILIMKFIGKEGSAAPILQKIKPETYNPQPVYEDLIKQIDNLWNKAHLVHGDLSAYNILLLDDIPYIIDLGQGVVQDHHLAEPFLYRDIENVIMHFESIGLKCADSEDLYEQITGNKANIALKNALP